MWGVCNMHGVLGVCVRVPRGRRQYPALFLGFIPVGQRQHSGRSEEGAALVKKVLDLGKECETGGFPVFDSFFF